MNALIWTLIGFILGAIPFSVWLGRAVLHTDVRRFGDGNPGATNVFRAGNFSLGMLAIFLDILKGAAPVALAAYVFRVTGWSLVLVILAPVFGHAFSPFLGFRGGKAVATTFGAWIPPTVPFGPFVMALSLLLFKKLQAVDGWSVMAAWAVWLIFLALRGISLPLLAAWAGTASILAWKHRSDLRKRPALRRGILKAVKR